MPRCANQWEFSVFACNEKTCIFDATCWGKFNVFYFQAYVLFFNANVVCISMKQISQMEENPFTSSSNICPQKPLYNGVGVGGVSPPTSQPPQLMLGYFI
jgi:hypothetical protein